jgi:diadenosine tetraphosphatase ApaH/serine/threonine PP2A family protein phosphatase
MRVLVVSDIHANRAALEAVLEDAGQVGFDFVWCLGDIVGYGPEPDWCVGRIRRLGAAFGLKAIVGNHDWAALERMEVDDFNPEAARTVVWTRKNLSDESLAWLSELPKDPIVEEERFMLAHGSPRDSVWEYILDPYIARDNFQASEFVADFCLVGHTHVPVLYTLQDENSPVRARKPVSGEALHLPDQGRAILNPGSVGQPRDGDPRAAYAILDTVEGTWQLRRVAYPIEITQAHMRDAGLPERLITRLSFGW